MKGLWSILFSACLWGFWTEKNLTWDFSWRNNAFDWLKLKEHVQQWQASILNLILSNFFFQSMEEIVKKPKTTKIFL